MTLSMKQLLLAGIFLCLSVQYARADTKQLLVPVFAENISGAGGSTWRSELRLYNRGTDDAVVRVERLFPFPGSNCSGLAAITVRAGQQMQLRSLGCGTGATAAELSLPDTLEVYSVITNTGNQPPEGCCYVGYTQHILLEPLPAAYTTSRDIANVPLPLRLEGITRIRPVRHNLGIVNPNEFSITVQLRYYDEAGIEDPGDYKVRSVVVPARTTLQVNDIIGLRSHPTGFPADPVGYWRIRTESMDAFYSYISQVDNQTNDATLLPSIPATPGS